MSFKRLFARSLSADPRRLHVAAHSHHLWPDASYAGHLEAWDDAAHLADGKWVKVMDEVWPAAQAEVAAELGTSRPDAVVFAPNTHELLVRLFAALAARLPVTVLTTDGEFHSARRQLARWEEEGTARVERVPVEPFDTFSERFLEAALRGGHDLLFVSQVMFGSGRVFERTGELAAIGRVEGPWVLIDGYHAFMAIPRPFSAGDGALATSFSSSPNGAGSPHIAAESAFYLGGGYKYAMAGEGCAFMHAPPGFGSRPPITGWYAEFDDLSLPPGTIGYARDARRFLGATFDPSGLYRFLAVRRMLQGEGLTTELISSHVATLQAQLLECLSATPLAAAELLNPIGDGPHARFLAFRSPDAQRWHADLKARNCITDVRGDVLRIGFGLYHDAADVERLVSLLGEMT